jgi:hypothetical protein
MEKIYTIPINEAFDECAADPALGCPFCRLHDKVENTKLDTILGAAMMEPDVRIQTNELGFCRKHFDRMFQMKNRLGLALILESHLNHVREHMSEKTLAKLDGSCYICAGIEGTLSKMFENAVYLWEADPEFGAKITRQPYICLTHFRKYYELGSLRLNKKKFTAFSELITSVTVRYFDTLREDVSWFCKKFDYRYDAEPWYNAKDAVERAIRFLKP